MVIFDGRTRLPRRSSPRARVRSMRPGCRTRLHRVPNRSVAAHRHRKPQGDRSPLAPAPALYGTKRSYPGLFLTFGNRENFDAATGAFFAIPIAVDHIRAFHGRAGRSRYGPTADRVGAVIERLRAYAGAGAFGAFVPGVADAATIAPIAHAVPVPLNVLLMAGIASLSELASNGVARSDVRPPGTAFRPRVPRTRSRSRKRKTDADVR